MADPRIAQARSLGEAARRDFDTNGGINAPARDPAVLALLEGEPVGGAGVAILTAWNKGWMAEHRRMTDLDARIHDANLSAEIMEGLRK